MVDVMILKKIKCSESGQYGLTCTVLGQNISEENLRKSGLEFLVVKILGVE